MVCPNGEWYWVSRQFGELTTDASGQDFEIAEPDGRWVDKVEARFCFSWVEFHAWAIRTGYEYRFVDELTAEGWVLTCGT